MKISVSSYSFAQYQNAGKLDMITTLEKAREMGFEAIEFTDLPGGDHEKKCELAAKLRKRADELGMDINAHTVSANLYRGNDADNAYEVERIKRKLDVAKILGASVLRHDACWSVPSEGKVRSFDAMLPTIAKNAREITEYAQKLGIKTCVENHGYVAQDSDRMERLFNAVDHENFGLLVDMGNFVCVDENNVTAVSRVAPYAVHAHAKDMYISKTGGEGFGETRGCNYFKGAVLGEGDVDVARCVAVLKKAGYDGYLSIEFEGSEDCIDGIARGFAYLKTLI
ncbi:MAG: sugar phosphate isomerase/epimerase [Ruminococcaceae bacterium]|nr:sugar phosphate isomerase/epimerase [Oscillospiraceae bacterium]